MNKATLLMVLILLPLAAWGEELIIEFEKIEQPTTDKVKTYYYDYMYLMSRGPSEDHIIESKPISEPLKPMQVQPGDWHGRRCLRVTFWAVETNEKCLVESILVGRAGTMWVESSWYIPPRAISGAVNVTGRPFEASAIQWLGPKTFDLIDNSDYYDLFNDTDIKGPRIIRLSEKAEGKFAVTVVSRGTVVPKVKSEPERE